jgi:hypothetical protein
MLRYFFEQTRDSNAGLFEGLLISRQPEIMAHQGQYPTIYLTFKDVKEMTWKNCLYPLRLLLASEFSRLKSYLSDAFLEQEETEIIHALHNPQASSAAQVRQICSSGGDFGRLLGDSVQ